MFNTTTQLISDLADEIKKLAPNLPAYWTNAVTQGQLWAYNTIISRLAERGFLLSQITSWDQGADFERHLTLWRAMMRMGAIEGWSSKGLDSLDVRDELKEISVTIAGVFTYPLGTAGQAHTGPEDTSNDIFVWPDPSDDKLGEVTHW